MFYNVPSTNNKVIGITFTEILFFILRLLNKIVKYFSKSYYILYGR